jgi:MFS family permease
MTEGEQALLGSLSSVGALVSTPLAGIFLGRVGRKPCAVVSISASVVSIISGTLLIHSFYLYNVFGT